MNTKDYAKILELTAFAKAAFSALTAVRKRLDRPPAEPVPLKVLNSCTEALDDLNAEAEGFLAFLDEWTDTVNKQSAEDAA